MSWPPLLAEVSTAAGMWLYAVLVVALPLAALAAVAVGDAFRRRRHRLGRERRPPATRRRGSPAR